MTSSQVPPELLPYLLGEKEDFSSLQHSIIKVNIIFITLIVITTALRFWVRFRMLRAVGLDDVLMILALVFALLLSTACLIGSHFGLGLHLWNLSSNIFAIPEQTARVTKALYGCYLSYSFAIAFVKFSIIATYFRIFADGLLRRTLLAVGFIVLALLICNIFAIIFTCIPVEAAWKYELHGKCFPIVDFFYASSAINIATDLALCFLPVPTLWALSMPKPQRVVLCILFGLGAFTCVASILRLTTLHNTSGAKAKVDFSYNTVISLNWCVIEVGAAIICTSLSALRPLATRCLPKLFSHLTINTNNSTKRATKLSSLSRSRSKFGNKTDEGTTDDDGQIYIEQTFDVHEEWEGVERAKDGNKMGNMVRTDRSKESEGMYTRTTELFERSSEEELVQGPKNSIKGGRR